MRDLLCPRCTHSITTIRFDRSSFGPLFDAADASASVDRRSSSTVVPQAFRFLNHPFSIEASGALASRLLAEAPPAGAAGTAGRGPEGASSAREEHCQLLLSANQFVYIASSSPLMEPW